jgi:hypothetical protein
MPDYETDSARTRFNNHFATALEEFNRNLAARSRGMTDDQVQTFRALCAARAVAFEPDHYSRVETGQFVGWIGGRDCARPPSARGTIHVGVDPDGVATGIGGGRVEVPPTA